MFERIAVALDGSTLSEAVLPHVARMAMKGGSDVLLIHAMVPSSMAVHQAVYDGWMKEARQNLESLRKRFEEMGIPARIAIEVGSPATVVGDVVKREKCTLLALATHGRSGVERVILGSLGEAILRESTVPVYLLRPWGEQARPIESLRSQTIRNVLVPLDLSGRSASIIPHAIEAVKRFDSRAILIHTIEPDDPEPGHHRDEEAHRELQEVVEEFRRQGCGALAFVERGDPAESILSACARHEAGLIAMSTHGRSGFARLFVGSVTEKVVRKSPVPVLALRTASQEAVAERTGVEAVKGG